MTAQGVEIEITVVVVVGRQAQDRPPLVDEPRPPGDLQKATPSLIAKQQVGEAKVAHVDIGITVRVVVEGQRAKAVPARAQHAVKIAELDEALLVRPALVLVCAGAAMRREQVHPAIAVVIGKSGARRGPGIGELDVDKGQAPIHVFEELIGTEEVDGVQIKIAIGVVVDEDPAYGRARLHAIQIGGDKGPIPLVAVEQRSRIASQSRDKQIRAWSVLNLEVSLIVRRVQRPLVGHQCPLRMAQMCTASRQAVFHAPTWLPPMPTAWRGVVAGPGQDREGD